MMKSMTIILMNMTMLMYVYHGDNRYDNGEFQRQGESAAADDSEKFMISITKMMTVTRKMTITMLMSMGIVMRVRKVVISLIILMIQLKAQF